MKTPLIREKLTLRLPPTLHRSLKAVAVDNGRSLNAEIVQRLRRSLEASPDQTTATDVVGVGVTTVQERR